MTSQQPTITGELRKWRVERHHHDGSGTVCGVMYNDRREIWHDGEAAVIHFSKFKECSGFYLAITGASAIKCYKDELKEGGIDPGKASSP